MVLLASQFNASFPSFFLYEHGSMIQGPHALELINFKAICGHGLYIYRSVTFFRKSHYVSNIFYFSVILKILYPRYLTRRNINLTHSFHHPLITQTLVFHCRNTVAELKSESTSLCTAHWSGQLG